MKHHLPKLPYPKDALSPIMSSETLEYHHDKHQRGYLEKLNELVTGTPFADSSLDQLVKETQGSIFNNAAQAWNHEFFWKCMTPERHDIPQMIRAAIERSFKSTDRFLDEFTQKGKEHFGSGWVWLVEDSGILKIETTQNADNPMREGRTPLLTCDLWEHAYYIDYRNDRAKFLAGFVKLINWESVETKLGSSRPPTAKLK